MIIVLILTSIVVGLAFSVLTLVQKHLYGIQDNFNRNTELNKLEQSLWLDFNRYSEINYNALENELRFTNELDSITYKFKEHYIVKGLDSFPIELKSKSLFFGGEFVNKGKIDGLKLEASKTFRYQHLFVFKHNDATQFMN